MIKSLLIFSFVLSAQWVEAKGLAPYTSENMTPATPLQSINLAKTPFDTLLEYFETGTAPTTQDLVGWYSGRCYSPFSPEVATAAMFFAKEYTSQGGPLFPQGDLRFAVGGIQYNGIIVTSPADYYDDITPEEHQIVANSIDSLLLSLSTAVVTRNGLSSSYGATTWTAKMNQGYIVVEQTVQTNGSPSVDQMCYFFKRID